MNARNPILSPAIGKRLRLGAALGVAALLALHLKHAAADCTSPSVVANQTELENAIAAFNAETTTPCTFTISVANDIGLTYNLPAPGVELYTLLIDNTTGGINLAINGNGYAVAGPDVQVNEIRPFTIASGTTVTINELTIQGGYVASASSSVDPITRNY
jgi:hypothetical protein